MTDAGGVTLRRLATHAEYEACVRLQYDTWGAEFREAVPASVLHVAQEIGGVVAGAFDERGALAGFVFGLTGVRGGRLVHWSDMLAVRPGDRNRGLGVRLKALQRDLVRPLGVEAILWTFDPLVARNAHLNLTRLGARVVEYVEDMYGSETGSPLHGALGTDRLIVAWDVTPEDSPSARAEREAAMPGREIVPPGQHLAASRSARGDEVRIEIPADIHALLASDPEAAAAWRRETRAAFRHHLGRGWRVVGFAGGRTEPRPCYLLAPPDSTG